MLRLRTKTGVSRNIEIQKIIQELDDELSLVDTKVFLKKDLQSLTFKQVT